ncbi:MAG: HEAT repeat domain-containing protein [Planctomycetota bacterium]|jgi:HEAT repeat protein
MTTHGSATPTARGRRIGGAVAAVAVALPLTGCAESTGDGQAWSTRDQSVLGRVPPEPTLQVDPAVPAVTDASGRRAAAIAVLQEAVDADVPLLRANGIESLQHAPAYLDGAVRRGLADDNRGVRFVAAMTVGRVRLESLSHLLEPLLADPSPSVRAAAIYALNRCGRPADVNPLGVMLLGDDPEVKANAAMVLGELGNPSAVPMLRAARGRGMPRVSAAQARIVDLQIAEAMVKLGADEELEGIRAALFVPPEQGELTALACQICARVGDRAVINNLQDLATRTGAWQQSPEVRMAATMALAELEPSRYLAEIPLEYLPSERPELRAQAALTLGAGGRAEDLSVLTARLGDPNPMVQVSAAAAILQIVPE